MVAHSVHRQSRNTPPSGVSKEKKFGRRNKFARSAYFFSSASEYCPKNRTACSSLSRCRRVTRTSFFVCFSSKTPERSPSQAAASILAPSSPTDCFQTSFHPHTPIMFSSSFHPFLPSH